MAGRSARPAVLTRGWRSRPGVVRVAAVLLGLFGLLLVLVEAEQGDLDAAELVTALVLVSAAVGAGPKVCYKARPHRETSREAHRLARPQHSPTGASPRCTGPLRSGAQVATA